MSKFIEKVKDIASRESVTTTTFACLYDLLLHHGRQAPDRYAILAPGCLPMTYGALSLLTHDVVRALRSAGVSRTDRVAVVLPNGPEAAVAMVTLAVGAVCVPLSPDFTYDEYKRYFADLDVAALLAHADPTSACRRAASSLGIRIIDVVTRPGEGAGAFHIVSQREPPNDQLASSSDDAFILLTSGSTSRPKMVPLTHASVCLSARNVGVNLELGPRDRLLSVLPLFHGHGLISGVLAGLTAGSSVVCTPGFDPTAFFGWLRKFRPTWYTAVPAVHQAILREAILHKQAARRSSLRLIRSASTSLARDALSELEALFGVPVIDTYGMTEAATQITANPLHRRKLGSVGRPAGPEIAIVDSEGRRLPAGKRGEIELQGPTITRRYHNDAAATASAFRKNWFRTGDIGYFDEEGYLFIVGRIKEIIHKGGQKVAPAEVEEALLSHPDVIDAAVFPVPHERLGAEVAAAVVLSRDAEVSAQKLRDFARKLLSGFKVPGVIHIVSEIPKGAGGKINRGQLAAALSAIQPSTDQRGADMVAPRSELECQLAGIWAEILGSDQVEIDQDIFALGIDSLAMAQMILRLEERFGVQVSFEDIFSAPTVTALANRVETLRKGSGETIRRIPTIEAADCAKADGPQPVSIVQERMLRVERKLPGLPQFNLPFAYRLQGALDVPALRQSLGSMVRRHACLRTAFHWRNEAPTAVVAPDVDVEWILSMKNLAMRSGPRSARAKELQLTRAKLEVQQATLEPIDMTRAPLFRAHLFRLDTNDHILLFVVHDIIVDGWSMVVFMEELSELYSASVSGRKSKLPEPELQFSEFARWQRQWCTGIAADKQYAYWKERLNKVSLLFNPPKINVVGELTARIIERPFQLSDELVVRLRDFCRSQGVTLFMTLLAVFKTLLVLRSGCSDICVATLMANRGQLARESVIGPFANTTLLRTQIDASLTFVDAVHRVRETVVAAHAMQELPFDVIAARLAKETDLRPATLVRIYFVLQVAFRRSPKLRDLTAQPFTFQKARTAMPIDCAWLSMALQESPTGIKGICALKKDLFAPNADRDWIADYLAVVAKAVANPDRELGRLCDF
ncbi:AMP-binding protein [Bradyrhizobium sp. CW12]|nr:AMP-binding protein [Bradyrhizobium sp. CW12]MCK1649357.1 AMP-binding protein [Bradyrhizobium sp. 154]